MDIASIIKRQFKVNRSHAVLFVSVLVGTYGVYIIADTLLDNILLHHHDRINSLFVDIPLLIGISVIYLSTLLKRQKRTAWIVTTLAYTLYLGIGLSQELSRIAMGRLWWIDLIRSILLPLIILLLLFIFRNEFIVKSDINGLHFALRFILIILTVTLIYGVSGFELMDNSDFHQEIGLKEAIHYTVDQFNITTQKPIKAYTKRAHLFVDSLSFISFVSLVYAALSLFQPIRSRFSDQSLSRDKVESLLKQYGAESEEFFKLWPHDKQYYFDDSGESAIAFNVHHGVALSLSDPIGNKERFKPLLEGFLNLCFHNDWLPALVHVADTNAKLYEKNGFTLQLLGQEAVVSLEHFETELKESKYFRQILNKFNKQDYSYELLSPPHHKAVIERLRIVSDEWLSKGSRSERGFVMGYFTDEYIQMCQIAVARDAAGTIQAFANIVPADFNSIEATYDMLRQSNKALSNITDYLLMCLIAELYVAGYKRLNMGLSPLAGLDQVDSDRKTILDNVLKFAYANGDMFYSFNGLYRFKSKYEPSWQDRYVGFKGGIRGFSKTMTALTRFMSKVVKL